MSVADGMLQERGRSGLYVPQVVSDREDRERVEAAIEAKERAAKAKEEALEQELEQRQREVESIRGRLTDGELEEHKTRFIAELKETDQFNYNRLRKDEWSSPGFRVMFDIHLR